MKKEMHLLGNGSSVWLFDHSAPGIRLTCNLPPFPVENAIGTAMVDFKIMKAIADGSLKVPGEWILGTRPKKFCEQFPQFHMRYINQIREFYTYLPPYSKDYTVFSCGHMAAHYLCSKFKPDVLHMYGFDSMFDFESRSCSDFYLASVRDGTNTLRLTNNWREIWPHLFAEFSNTKFLLHSKHDHLKIQVPSNAEIFLHK